ncbi:hypothetical protein EYF80_022681 [Liparis tanakae]|uniref:Uncharacterized protein n=1 Tax=Liparis tanakae TaxID=230148 RepID=A0A4Z2HNM1_9TELE|nr:hypothetical protein EYF80_022681 [Liparis tanakae]
MELEAAPCGLRGGSFGREMGAGGVEDGKFFMLRGNAVFKPRRGDQSVSGVPRAGIVFHVRSAIAKRRFRGVTRPDPRDPARPSPAASLRVLGGGGGDVITRTRRESGGGPLYERHRGGRPEKRKTLRGLKNRYRPRRLAGTHQGSLSAERCAGRQLFVCVGIREDMRSALSVVV